MERISENPDVASSAEEVVGALESVFSIKRETESEERISLFDKLEDGPLSPTESRSAKFGILVANACMSMGTVLASRKAFTLHALTPTISVYLNQACFASFYLVGFLIYYVTMSTTGRPFGIQPPRFKLSKLVYLLPSAVFLTSMTAFNNYCLEAQSVIGYMVSKSTALLFTLFLSWAVLKQPVHKDDLIGVAIVTVGFTIGGVHDLINNDHNTTSVRGIFFGLAGSVSSTLFITSMKWALPRLDNQETAMTFFNSVGVLLLLAPIIMKFDSFEPLINVIYLPLYPHKLIVLLSVICGCAVTFTLALAVKMVGPVAIGVSSYVKSVVQSFLSVVWLGETCSISNVVGLMFTLIGSAYYTNGRLKRRKLN